MIASIVILALVLIGCGWWWVVKPHGRGALGRDSQLPLFSARTPGSALRVVGAGPRARRGAGATSPQPDEEYLVQLAAAAAPATAASPRQPVATDREVPRPRIDETATRAPEPRRVARTSRVVLDAAPTEAPAPGANGAGRSVPLAAAPSRPEAPPSLEDYKWAPPSAPLPANGTVEFLPGRLEVVQGRSLTGQEVRFVRPSRPGERAVVTFGRGEGPPYRHVQLNVPTVSRLHARLSQDDATGRWAVENLSSTNPTVLNGDELAAGGTPRPLGDGDRLEMGEVVFTFRTQ